MGQSSRLRFSDIDGIFSLVNECRELWADPAAWRGHLVQGISRLTRLRIVQYTEIALGPATRVPNILCRAAVGFPQDRDWQVYQEAIRAYPNKFDFFLGSFRLVEEANSRGHAAALREELCPDREWYRSRVYNEFRRPVRSDGNLLSIATSATRQCSVIDVNQCEDDPRPCDRTKQLVSLTHCAIQPLIGRELAIDTQISMLGLSPKQREVLRQLLEGKSEKLIATHFGVRPSTIHDHVGKIFRHFKVRSKVELMAYFIRRRPIERSRTD